MPTSAGGSAASEWQVGDLLDRVNRSGIGISSGANYDTNVICQGASTMVVEVDMTGDVAGDLTVQVLPFEFDAGTVMWVAIAPVASTGPTLVGGDVYYTAQFDVTAYDKVRTRITNNSVDAQALVRASCRLV